MRSAWGWILVGGILETLWASGEAMTTGGVLSGVLAQAFVQVFSAVGAAVIFVLGLLMSGLGAFDLTIVDVADWIFTRPRYEYEPEAPPERPVVRAPRPEPRASERRAAADIDIPVEDGPLVGKEPPPPPEKKKHFFDRRPRVPSPDQLLTGGAATPAAPEEAPAPAPQPEVKAAPAGETRHPCLEKSQAGGQLSDRAIRRALAAFRAEELRRV